MEFEVIGAINDVEAVARGLVLRFGRTFTRFTVAAVGGS
jgi:hypothetical protein